MSLRHRELLRIFMDKFRNAYQTSRGIDPAESGVFAAQIEQQLNRYKGYKVDKDRTVDRITSKAMQDAYRIGFLHGQASRATEEESERLNAEAAKLNEGLKFNVEFKL